MKVEKDLEEKGTPILPIFYVKIEILGYNI